MLHALICSAAMILAAPPGTEAEPGFVSLFDGKDLARWIVPE
jgi:hypothetical protein